MRKHITDKGKLVFHHSERQKINNRTLTKEYFQCEKCGQILQVITMPSYEEYVLMGQIWVSYEELTEIRKNHAYLMQKQEERKNDKKMF